VGRPDRWTSRAVTVIRPWSDRACAGSRPGDGPSVSLGLSWGGRVTGPRRADMTDVNCQTASSVPSGTVARHSKILGAPVSRVRVSPGTTHLHGRFRSEGNRRTSVSTAVTPTADRQRPQQVWMVEASPPTLGSETDLAVIERSIAPYAARDGARSWTACHFISSKAFLVCMMWSSRGTSFRAMAHIALVLAPPLRARSARYSPR
jgi:hypothetical protein